MKFAYFALIAISMVLLAAMAGCTSAPQAEKSPTAGTAPVAAAGAAGGNAPKAEVDANSATPPAAKEEPIAEVKNDTPKEIAPVIVDSVHELKFVAKKIGALDIIRMGTRGTYNLTPIEGNEYIAVLLTMGNEGSQDKKISVAKPQLSMNNGKKYAFSYKKSHEASISEHMPFVCDFKMDEPSDAGFSAKAYYGKSRIACLVFEAPLGLRIESLGFGATVSDSEKTDKAAVSIPVAG